MQYMCIIPSHNAHIYISSLFRIQYINLYIYRYIQYGVWSYNNLTSQHPASISSKQQELWKVMTSTPNETTYSSWKWMVGILVAFWEDPFSGAIVVLGKVSFLIHLILPCLFDLGNLAPCKWPMTLLRSPSCADLASHKAASWSTTLISHLPRWNISSNHPTKLTLKKLKNPSWTKMLQVRTENFFQWLGGFGSNQRGFHM